MRRAIWFMFACGVAFAAAQCVRADSAPPQQMLKTYALHDKPNSADISPDEQMVVTECTLRGSEPGKFDDVVELWNFKDDKMLARRTLSETQGRPLKNGGFVRPFGKSRIVRFSTNGAVVAALIENKIHVLSVPDFTETPPSRLLPPPFRTR